MESEKPVQKKKKIDARIKTVLQNAVIENHRAMFVIVGDKARDQVVYLHHMLSKEQVKARPTVLWCYKKELGFSSHRQKKMKKLQKKLKSGKMDFKEDDPFEMFVAATNIKYCYYSESQKILGNTFGMCVLQDFEALSPNLLARTVETVEGGGIVVLLLKSVTSLKQLYTMTMDVHARYRTESHQEVVGRFNERFILSLARCKACLVVDDKLNLLPLSSHMRHIEQATRKTGDEALSKEQLALRTLREEADDNKMLQGLLKQCRTFDQATVVQKLFELITAKQLQETVFLKAARGRGKSASLGLAMSAAVACGYSNIFVTSPSPENLKTLFEFVFKGFDALAYEERRDYSLVQSTNPDFNKAIVRINVFKDHRQTIQYIHPTDADKLGQAELVCIDEAAAIPLPLVKKLLGPYLVFMSTTQNGYEGTGRSLSLKLISELQKESSQSALGRRLTELQMCESIRYAPGDKIERWLYEVLCLDVESIKQRSAGRPHASDCQLYYVSRDALFSGHQATEDYLRRIMMLYVSSHYRNSPNDLQMLSDAPAHHIFCLFGPFQTRSSDSDDGKQAVQMPDPLCVVQVCLEGEISKKSVMSSMSRGERPSGDLIPWNVSQQFQDSDFAKLSGGRIIRIATHPDCQNMGYGSRALQLLKEYYEGRIIEFSETEGVNNGDVTAPSDEEESSGLLEERIRPRKKLPPLFLQLSERRPERLDYLGVACGLTAQLLKFWKRSSYVPVYLRQTANELTGEHTCILLHQLKVTGEETHDWLTHYFTDFRRRCISLLSYQFSEFQPPFAYSILKNSHVKDKVKTLSRDQLDEHVTPYDIRRLELHTQSLADYHLVTDLLPVIAALYFSQRLRLSLTAMQNCILIGVGLQRKNLDKVSIELQIPHSQALSLLTRTLKQAVEAINKILEKNVAEQLGEDREAPELRPAAQSLQEDLAEAARQGSELQKSTLNLDTLELKQFAIKGSENEWQHALKLDASAKGQIKIGSLAEKRKKKEESDGPNKKKKKHKHTKPRK